MALGVAIARQPLDDGRELRVVPVLGGRAQLCLGLASWGACQDVWEYASAQDALTAMVAFDPTVPGGDQEPAGWVRHPATGRMRPDGDPAREYVVNTRAGAGVMSAVRADGESVS